MTIKEVIFTYKIILDQVLLTSVQLLKLLLIILNCQIEVKLCGFCLRIQGSPQTIVKVFV